MSLCLLGSKGCPFAAEGDAGGCGLRTAPAAHGMAAGCRGAALAASLAEPDPILRDAALRAFAMLAGATVLARASDAKTAWALLAACGASDDEDVRPAPRQDPGG